MENLDTLPVLNPPQFPHCFVCGPENPDGLHLVVHRDGTEAVAEYRPRPTHEGYPDRFHGGLVGLLVDEMLVYAGAAQDLWGMTAKVTYALRAPISPSDHLLLRSRVTSDGSRAFRAEVDVRIVDGEMAAQGEGMCVLATDLEPQHREQR